MKTASSATTAVGGDPTSRPTLAAWSSSFETPHSYTSRPPSLQPTLRPWREFLSLRSFSLPYGYSDALLRLRKNLSHFRFNYALIALLALFLSLIFHPYSLLLFVFLFLAWYALYFSRDSPIVLFGRVFDDRVVAAVLGVVTIVGLVLTGVGLTVLVAKVEHHVGDWRPHSAVSFNVLRVHREKQLLTTWLAIYENGRSAWSYSFQQSL